MAIPGLESTKHWIEFCICLLLNLFFYAYVEIHISRSCVKKGALLAQLFRISYNYTWTELSIIPICRRT